MKAKSAQKLTARQRSRQIAKDRGFILQNSYVLYCGPSMLDSTVDVVAVVSGFVKASSNGKTKDVLQVSYFRADMHPQDAINTGGDRALCGDCPFTKIGGKGVRLCYVRMQPIFGQYRKFSKGGYEALPTMDLLNGWKVRLGAYGDPACIPLEISHNIVSRALHVKAYTHSWERFPELSSFCMASVESEADFKRASKLGFRCFRVRSEFDDSLLKREILCMNTQRGLNCEDCPFCEGTKKRSMHIAVTVHGPSRIVSGFNARYNVE